jgi:hypothetical protein
MAADERTVNTEGGASVSGGVRITRGDFVAGDKIIINKGATVDEIVKALREEGILSTVTTRLPEEAFRKLLNIFAAAAVEDAGERLYLACRVTLPPTARLVNSEIPALLLANMCEQPLAKAWPPIFECLERFIAADGIPETLATELREWTDGSASLVNPLVLPEAIGRLRREIRADVINAAKPEAFSWLQVYLEPDAGNRTYQRKQPLFRVELVLWSPNTNGALVLQTAEGNEAGNDRPSLWTLDQLPSLLDQVFANRETAALIPEVRLLFIEIVAPSDVLLYGFDRWKRKQSTETYGTFAPVVVRLGDRLAIPDPIDQKTADEFWRSKWNAFHSQLRNKTCNLLPWRAQEKLDVYQLQDEQELACLGVSTPLHAGGRDVFDTLRDAGIPVALWMRGSELGPEPAADLHIQISRLLEQSEMCELRQAIQRLRRLKDVRDDATHFCNALTLLWDDPDRPLLKYEPRGVFV